MKTQKEERIVTTRDELKKVLWKVLATGIVIGIIVTSTIFGAILVKTEVITLPEIKIPKQEEPCYAVACECKDIHGNYVWIYGGKRYHCGLHQHDCEYGE
jgi:hypothetical protein